jgi:hypothetical protein
MTYLATVLATAAVAMVLVALHTAFQTRKLSKRQPLSKHPRKQRPSRSLYLNLRQTNNPQSRSQLQTPINRVCRNHQVEKKYLHHGHDRSASNNSRKAKSRIRMAQGKEYGNSSYTLSATTQHTQIDTQTSSRL